jgi:hypothetical protein
MGDALVAAGARRVRCHLVLSANSSPFQYGCVVCEMEGTDCPRSDESTVWEKACL